MKCREYSTGDRVTVNMPGHIFHERMFEFVTYNGRHHFAIVRVAKRFGEYRKGEELRLAGKLLAALEKSS